MRARVVYGVGSSMIKVKIVAVGKVKEKYFLEAIKEYEKRLSRYAEFKIVEVKEENFVSEPNEAQKQEILKKEANNLKKELKGFIVAMCIEGKKYDSVGFSKLISEVKKQSGELTLVIGGSYGLSDEIKGIANLKMSVSDMTFPHTLFRVMLVEQLYRAFSIEAEGKYHK